MDKDEGTVILLVLVVICLVLSVQSCRYSGQNKPTDDMIQEAGRELLVEKNAPASVTILEDKVERPGRHGNEYGYWAKYQITKTDGTTAIQEHYDE